MPDNQNASLLSQLSNIAQGLSETFAPFCEVVVHDLSNPEHAILAIYNNLSGRDVGDPATELGLARIASPEFPGVISNYANTFSDGRPVKSTSVGIKNDEGQYVAALCLNVDMSLFRGMQSALQQFTDVSPAAIAEHLEPGGSEAIRKRIDRFAARLATTPRALKAPERRQLMQELKENGLLDVKKSMDTIALHLGVSRATVYLYAKECS
ncbi:helix-turn-helix transcriptional regulator [[Enterobacter] lignolyticus]|uniref:YheO-like domain-containing protein n=2 Tax=[Enterobacter] lignolyticus TaxID=1334193 RepID=E3GBB6_ENTLS|nr:PAS domain-containing protein [[Enterobacter] lignolyticus]ADO48879.1 YheO-like domain-containing protein [[Enterobacter] lignolyticus SCF1]ALR76442.1 DNA-binding protein [[Enterobacter] lignolyticus]